MSTHDIIIVTVFVVSMILLAISYWRYDDSVHQKKDTRTPCKDEHCSCNHKEKE